MRALLTTCAIAVACAAGLRATSQGAPPQKVDQMMGDDLYAAYLTGSPIVLTRAFPDARRFEAFRSNFRDRVLTRWEAAPREPRRALFMLDIALATEPRHYLYWSDFLLLGQTYLRQRPEAPGVNPRLDAFELQWNKTALAFLEGRRQPELVEELVKRLAKRIVPARLADGPPALVDPWIALTMGFAQEGYVIADPSRAATRTARALEFYGEATNYDSTRAEAIVRSAGILLHSGRPADALAALDRWDDGRAADDVLIYWARLFRGKALDALERPDESIAAYTGALDVAPTAQSPLVGMMMAESRRGRDEAAEALAERIRTARDPVDDPWWIYPHGDLRFYHQRLNALREMAK